MTMNRDFTYIDGIVEGRLIENDFCAVGNFMFFLRKKNCLYVVTHHQKDESILEVFSELPGLVDEMSAMDFIELARSETYEVLKVRGHIDDIIAVMKLAKSHYD